jgi:hypothetical protein
MSRRAIELAVPPVRRTLGAAAAAPVAAAAAAAVPA